jgi:hypothetical protein
MECLLQKSGIIVIIIARNYPMCTGRCWRIYHDSARLLMTTPIARLLMSTPICPISTIMLSAMTTMLSLEHVCFINHQLEGRDKTSPTNLGVVATCLGDGGLVLEDYKSRFFEVLVMTSWLSTKGKAGGRKQSNVFSQLQQGAVVTMAPSTTDISTF